MATSPPIAGEPAGPAASPEPGAPVPRDAIDPDLVKLARTRPRIGVITAAAVIALSGYFIHRMGPDRRFAGEPEIPVPIAAADIAAGKIADNSHVAFPADPMMSHAIRTVPADGAKGLRVAPVRGTGERVWIVLPGTGEDPPTLKSYRGRLRRLSELPFAQVLDKHATLHPRPVFATPASVRAAFAGAPLTTVTGDQLPVADGDRVAFDTTDPDHATLIASFVGKHEPSGDDPGHGPLTDASLWIAELAKHGITATVSPAPREADAILRQVRLDVPMSVDRLNEQLLAAKLLATSVERVVRHYETTWGDLRRSPPAGLAVEGQTVPDAHVELLGLYVQRGVPADAYALLTSERPGDYWHVMPLTLALGALALAFLWALARGIRDLLPTRLPAPR